MAIIITYDIDSKHIAFKNSMKALGYKDQLTDLTHGKVYLPNTTLFHHQKDAANAVGDVQNLCRQLVVKLERCVATQWGPNQAVISGEPHKQ